MKHLLEIAHSFRSLPQQIRKWGENTTKAFSSGSSSGDIHVACYLHQTSWRQAMTLKYEQKDFFFLLKIIGYSVCWSFAANKGGSKVMDSFLFYRCFLKPDR